MNQPELLQLVVEAVREIWTLGGRNSSDSLDEQTPLLGRGAVVDSLGLVQLIVEVEQRLSSQGIVLSLTDEKAMSQRASPFLTIGSLVAFIEYQARKDG